MSKLDTNAPNMPGHAQRNQTGRLRKIRKDTHAGTLEKRYGVNFGVRDDMQWGTLQKKLNVDSLEEALKKARSK